VEIDQRVSRLVDAWCDRHALTALREILHGWPLSGGLTDDWAALAEALKGVRAFALTDLTDSELDELEKLIAAVDQLVFRQ
jgi:hypothetical protein